MPGVQIEYRKGVIGLREKRVISAAIRRFGAQHFSSPESLLEEEYFTIKYLPCDEGDELTDDIIIRVQLHHFPSRLEETDDKSKELANVVGDALTDTGFAKAITIGVSLLVCEIGWGAAVLHPSTQKIPAEPREEHRLIDF